MEDETKQDKNILVERYVAKSSFEESTLEEPRVQVYLGPNIFEFSSGSCLD